jgi:hypothetical protein
MQNLDRFAQLFSQEFSGLRAKRTVSQLTQLHRIQASPGLSAAVDLIHQAAEAAGLANVQVHRYPVDGKSYWWTWKKPWFWSPQSAELRLIAPEEEVLARLWRNSAALRTSRVAWALFAPRPRREASPLKWQTSDRALPRRTMRAKTPQAKRSWSVGRAGATERRPRWPPSTGLWA